MNAELALAALEFMPNKAAGIISKVIASAVANGDYEPEEVIITDYRVDKAAVMKRWRPRARGTATRILKPTSHIYVEVAEVSSVEASKPEKAPAKKAAKKEAPAESAAKAAAKEAAELAEKKGDDLTKIKGIGKAYQQKLNDEGIYTYEDVANMSDEQIAMMEEKYSFKGDFRESVADAKNFVNGKEA
jgi:large subunit ribosomal protein L22